MSCISIVLFLLSECLTFQRNGFSLIKKNLSACWLYAFPLKWSTWCRHPSTGTTIKTPNFLPREPRLHESDFGVSTSLDQLRWVGLVLIGVWAIRTRGSSSPTWACNRAITLLCWLHWMSFPFHILCTLNVSKYWKLPPKVGGCKRFCSHLQCIAVTNVNK